MFENKLNYQIYYTKYLSIANKNLFPMDPERGAIDTLRVLDPPFLLVDTYLINVLSLLNKNMIYHVTFYFVNFRTKLAKTLQLKIHMKFTIHQRLIIINSINLSS